MSSSATYLRNFIFGVEDSLVSTVGLLTGVAIAGVSQNIIILTGVVLIIVEALSMAVGSFLSEASVQEVSQGTADKHSVGGGGVMFVSYVLAGLVPLAPYVVVTGALAIYLSVICSLVALFVLGLVSGSLIGGRRFTWGIRMMLVGGIAIAAGIGAAVFLAQYGVAV